MARREKATSSLILPANRDRMAVVAQLRELGLTVDVRRESPRIQAAIARGKRRRAEQQQWLCEAVDMSERDFNDNGRLEHAIVRAATMADALEQFIAYLIEEERLPDILTREAILDQFEVTAELATVINRYPTSGGTE